MKNTIKELEQNLLKIFELKEWDSHEFFVKLHPQLRLTIEEDESADNK